MATEFNLERQQNWKWSKQREDYEQRHRAEKNVAWVQGIQFDGGAYQEEFFKKKLNIYEAFLMCHVFYIHYLNWSRKCSSEVDIILLTLEINRLKSKLIYSRPISWQVHSRIQVQDCLALKPTHLLPLRVALLTLSLNGSVTHGGPPTYSWRGSCSHRDGSHSHRAGKTAQKGWGKRKGLREEESEKEMKK